jgi:hypothetical protein
MGAASDYLPVPMMEAGAAHLPLTAELYGWYSFDPWEALHV